MDGYRESGVVGGFKLVKEQGCIQWNAALSFAFHMMWCAACLSSSSLLSRGLDGSPSVRLPPCLFVCLPACLCNGVREHL